MRTRRLFCDEDNKGMDFQSTDRSDHILGMTYTVPANTKHHEERNVFLCRHLVDVEERLNAQIANLCCVPLRRRRRHYCLFLELRLHDPENPGANVCWNIGPANVARKFSSLLFL